MIEKLYLDIIMCSLMTTLQPGLNRPNTFMMNKRSVPTQSCITHGLAIPNIQWLKATHRICAYSIIHEANRIKSIRYCCGMNERCIIDASSPALYISVCKSPRTASKRESKSTEAAFHHIIHLIYSFALA